jgi:hypothetical protein
MAATTASRCTSCGGPPAVSTDCSIRDGAVMISAVARPPLPDKTGHAGPVAASRRERAARRLRGPARAYADQASYLCTAPIGAQAIRPALSTRFRSRAGLALPVERMRPVGDGKETSRAQRAALLLAFDRTSPVWSARRMKGKRGGLSLVGQGEERATLLRSRATQKRARLSSRPGILRSARTQVG